MWRVRAGVVAVIVGLAAVVEAHSRRPLPPGYFQPGVPGAPARLSHTAYDLLRIGGSTLLILGGLVMLIGVVTHWRSAPSR